MNKIECYKNRIVNYNEPVSIYRNLNKKGVYFSILQNKRVVGHSTKLNLIECQFKVNSKARDRIRKTGIKQVHAFISGFITSRNLKTKTRIFYNPKLVNEFVILNTSKPIKNAREVTLNSKGVFTNDIY